MCVYIPYTHAKEREREREGGWGERESSQGYLARSHLHNAFKFEVSRIYCDFRKTGGWMAFGWLLDGYGAVDLCEWVSWGVCMGWAG